MLLLAAFSAVLCLVASRVLLQFKRSRRLEWSHGCEPPRKYAHKDPFGLDMFFQTGDMFKTNSFFPIWLNRFSVYGNTFSTKLFNKITICTCEPENLQDVFSTNAKNWGIFTRESVFLEYIGKGFLTTDGNEWKKWRTLLLPSFSSAVVRDHATYEQRLKMMMERIPGQMQTFDLQELISHLYLDTASEFLFGENFDFLSGDPSEDATTYLQSQEHVMRIAGVRIALGPLQVFHRDPQFRTHTRRVHGVIDKYIDGALEKHSNDASPMDSRGIPGKFSMLQSMKTQISSRIDIRNNIIQAFMASLDTTAFLISNMFWALARHPEIWQEIRQSVLERSKAELELMFDDAIKIPIITNVINETLRLYPVFPYMIRSSYADCTLPKGGGPSGQSPIYVPAGSDFSFNFAALHRRKDIYGLDADLWRPDRWKDLSRKIPPWHFAPFGGGQRACLGRQKAVAEASYFVCRMVQEFDRLESRDDRPWTGRVTVTASNVHGCLVALRRARKGEDTTAEL